MSLIIRVRYAYNINDMCIRFIFLYVDYEYIINTKINFKVFV